MFRFVAASRFAAVVVSQQVRTGSSSSNLPIVHTEAKPKETQLQEETEAALQNKERQVKLQKEREAKLVQKEIEVKMPKYFEVKMLEIEVKMQKEFEAKMLEIEAKMQNEFEAKMLEIKAKMQKEFEAKMLEIEAKMQKERQANLQRDIEAKQRREHHAKMLEIEAKLEEERQANLKKDLEDKLEEERYAKLLKKLEAELKEERRAKLLRELEANPLSEKWSAPTALNVLKIDATAVSKAADWATMGTLACVGVPEDLNDFDGRFRNTAADGDPRLAQNIKDRAVSVVELPPEAQLIDECAGKLFIRNRYLPYIASWVERSLNNPLKIPGRGRGERLIITAQPGIGKSVGVGNYLIHYFAGRLIGDASAAIVVRSFTHFHIIHDGKIESLPDVDSYEVDKSQESVLYKLQSPPYRHVKNVLLIYDVTTFKKMELGSRPLFYEIWLEIRLGRLFNSVTAVQLAPPDGVNDYRKDGLSMVSKIVIPAWAYDELESLQAHYPRTVTIDAKQEPYYTYRYDLFGGVLWTRESYLVDATMVAKHRAVLSASRTRTDFFDFGKFATSSVLKTSVPSDVALIVPNETFTDFSGFLDFVSDEVLIYCKSTVQRQVETYWGKRMLMVTTERKRGSVLESLMKSKLLLWRKSVADSYHPSAAPSTAPKSPFHYTFFGGSSKKRTVKICPGPFAHIVMDVSVSGREFAEMPAKCHAALGGEAGSVLVTFSNPNTPAIDFALLTRANSNDTWSAFLFQCTVASSHPFPKDATDVLEELFAVNGQADLNAFIWVGRDRGIARGVTAPQSDGKSTARFRGKQAGMSLTI